MLSEKHNINAIAYWLKEWMRAGAPCPQEPVSDFSWPFLALCWRLLLHTLTSKATRLWCLAQETKCQNATVFHQGRCCSLLQPPVHYASAPFLIHLFFFSFCWFRCVGVVWFALPWPAGCPVSSWLAGSVFFPILNPTLSSPAHQSPTDNHRTAGYLCRPGCSTRGGWTSFDAPHVRGKLFGARFSLTL